MAHLRCDFFSDALSLSTSMTVILPQRTTTQIGMTGTLGDAPPPVLYLLHGLSDDDTIWLRRTSIERYVAELGLAVVMPQVHRSFYADEAYGGRYWTFLSEELPGPGRARSSGSRPAREDTFVAGLSMGGYGALKWALRAARSASPPRPACPARWTSPGSAASATEDPMLFTPRLRRAATSRRRPTTCCGCVEPGRSRPTLPALHVGCGTEDALIDRNRAFVERCAARGDRRDDRRSARASTSGATGTRASRTCWPGLPLAPPRERRRRRPTRVRDHLANERTYLAWLRTAANVMVLGLAVARFVGDGSVGSYIAGHDPRRRRGRRAWYGTFRYRQVTRQIDEDAYATGTRGYAAVVASTVLVLAVATALAILFATRR